MVLEYVSRDPASTQTTVLRHPPQVQKKDKRRLQHLPPLPPVPDAAVQPAAQSKDGMKSAPRFFCEHCGVEVSAASRNCPKCGRFFASVKCPSCGYSGETALFRDGCPACGYALPGTPVSTSQRSASKKNRSRRTDPLPLWLYLLALALLAVTAVLIIRPL